MSLLLDPTICPDCRAPLDPTSTCTGCGLVLRGPEANEIWQHVQRAGRLVEHLRRTPYQPLPEQPPLPTYPVSTSTPAPRRVSGLTVPVVLLGLGALCLLVAATVFVAVTWSSLGLVGRTSILLGVTGVVTAVAAGLTVRGLRGSAETLWFVASVLVLIDLVAARYAGLAGLDDLAGRHVAALIGGVLLAGAVGVGTWATGTVSGRLHGLVAVGASGALLLAAGEAWNAAHPALGTAVSVPVLAAAAIAVARIRAGALRPTGYAVGSVAVLSWLVLVGQGLERSADVASSQWWSDLRGWPLLVAAAWAAAPTAVRVVPRPVRTLAAGASLLTLVLLALGGQASDQTKVLVSCGVLLALAAVSAVGRPSWSQPAALMTATGVVLGTGAVLVRPSAIVGLLPTTAPAHPANLQMTLPNTTWTLAAWTAPVIAAAVTVAAAGLLRHVPAGHRHAATRVWLVAAPLVLGTGAVTGYLETRPQLLPAVLAWSGLLAVTGVLAVVQRRSDAATLTALVAGTYLVAVDLRLAVASHLLVAALATVLAVALAALASRTASERLGGALVPVLAGPTVLLLGLAATHWPYVAHASGNTAGVALALVAAGCGLAAGVLRRSTATRVTVESTALVAGIASTAFPTDSTVVALTLTIVGSAVALTSIVHRDRDRLSWLAAAVLAVGTAIRVSEHAVAPELYAVPAACALVAAGVWRLLADSSTSSWRALGSGLTLGLLPSLLLAVDEPVSVRGALIAAAGVGVLALGYLRHWAAPFLAGAGVVAVLAVRHLAPVAEALPRWISLGSVGLALLLVGITWESRRRDAAGAERYLAALR